MLKSESYEQGTDEYANYTKRITLNQNKMKVFEQTSIRRDKESNRFW